MLASVLRGRDDDAVLSVMSRAADCLECRPVAWLFQLAVESRHLRHMGPLVPPSVSPSSRLRLLLVSSAVRDRRTDEYGLLSGLVSTDRPNRRFAANADWDRL